MPTARSEMRAAVVDGIIYVPGGFGGLTSFEAYDPANDSWTELAPMPEPAHHLMVAGHSGKVFVFGGGPDMSWQATASIFVYDPAAETWTAGGAMPERRMSGEAVSLGDFIYLVGGTGGTTALLRFDPAEDVWSVLPGPTQPREHVAAVAFNGELWVIGGRWGGTGALATVEIFDPASGAWRAGPEMNEARSGFGAAVVGAASWLQAARFWARDPGRRWRARRCTLRKRARGRFCRRCRRAFTGCRWRTMRGRRSCWAARTGQGGLITGGGS